MEFDPGFAIAVDHNLGFVYGPDVAGPTPEYRRLQTIRPSLLDPNCDGPDPVYSIAMDVAAERERPLLQSRMLLFGAVAYAAGKLGREPVRSQGHVHAIAPHSGWSPPELFEIWEGEAVVYAQESAGDDPRQCVAVRARPGNRVVVPPGWAHCVINADPRRRMVFGALCDREYGFVYDDIRRHHGLAWFPLLTNTGLEWQANPACLRRELQIHDARQYPELEVSNSVSIYRQFSQDPDALGWVSDPARKQSFWADFQP